MPRGQYTRKKPADAETSDATVSAQAEADAGDAPLVAEEPVADMEPSGEAPADGDAPSTVDPDGGSNDADTAAAAGDNVLYPVDDNPAASPGPLCPACFPAGWPVAAEQSVGCEHGMWLREWPPAGQDGS